MNSSKEWAPRLLNLRRRLDLDQQEMGNRLGVTREWVSRLERGRGEFSEIICLKIEELEQGKSDHKREPARAAEDAASYGGPEQIRREIEQHVAILFAAAKNDVTRLGWIYEQLRQHVATPQTWIRNEELNRIIHEIRRQQREADDPGYAPPSRQSQHTAKSA